MTLSVSQPQHIHHVPNGVLLSRIHILKPQFPVPKSMSVYGDRAWKEVIKLK